MPPSGIRGRAVVRREHHHRGVRHAQLVEQVEQLPDIVVEFDHSVGIDVSEAGDAVVMRVEVGPVMHPGRVVPDEEGLVGRDSLGNEALALFQHVLVEMPLHLLSEGAKLLDALAVFRGEAVYDAALGQTCIFKGLGGIIRLLDIFPGVQVIEDSEELVEPVVGGKVLVPVAEMVLAELPGAIAQRLEHLGERRVLRGETLRGPGQPDGRKAHPQRILPGDERGAPGGAGCLGIVVHEEHALVGDPVDVGRLSRHHPAVIGRDVPHPHVVAPDDEDVRRRGGFGFLGLNGRARPRRQRHEGEKPGEVSS